MSDNAQTDAAAPVANAADGADVPAPAPAPAKKKNKKKKKKTKDVDLPEPPAYLGRRIELFEEFQAAEKARIEALEDEPITVSLPDGTVISEECFRFKTRPIDISKKLKFKGAVVATVNGAPHDLMRPFEEVENTLELHTFESEEGKHAFWHTSAHVLGQALELLYGGSLGVGPALERGFYYDMSMQEEQLSQAVYENVDNLMFNICKENQPMERVEVTREAALEMFAYNPLKVDLITNDIPEGATITLYRCGQLVDLCRGPHLPGTGMIRTIKCTRNSSAYWKGKAENEVLQRMYGVSFPNAKLMKEHDALMKKAAENNHRKIGIDQELFFFHPMSPGSCFFLPHGARLYNRLVDFIKDHYWQRGYQEVVTPNIYNHELWKTSGHWQNYQENMFQFECEEVLFALKPMNCPGHCLMFAQRPRSHRELPFRMADFGVLHRNELSGALTGLTRVRRFQQDDAHIFCRPDQVQDEVAGVLDMLQAVYGVFGFTFELRLSTRPEKYLGEIAEWDAAEMQLQQALDAFGHPWAYNHGDGAFYGPKIDIEIKDALERKHQCATCQLDFQLPQRFDLEYVTEDGGRERPVMVHRAILGSVERMIAILTESYGGIWPFWLSPRQIMIVPVALTFLDYANQVKALLHQAGYFVDVDDSTRTLNNKIRMAEGARYNFILIVGEVEVQNGSVNIRHRSAESGSGKKKRVQMREVEMADLLTELAELTESREDDLKAIRE